MSQAPTPVRAVARVGTPATGDGMSANEQPVGSVRRRRRPGRLGPVNVTQIVVIEAILAGLLVLSRHNPILLISGTVLAILLLLFMFVRRNGRWWLEHVQLRREYRRRRKAGGIAAPDRRLAALRGLVPDLAAQTVESSGDEVGVGHDGAGWFASVAVLPPEGLNGSALGEVPLGALARVCLECEQPGAIFQVVLHTLPAPTTAILDNQPVALSYQAISQLANGAVPVDQAWWVSVRLDSQEVAEAAIGGADESASAPDVVATLARRAAKSLRRSGLPCRVLNADGLLDALARSCDLEQSQHSAALPAARETWRSWASGQLRHTTFWVKSWPQVTSGGDLLTALTLARAAMTSVTLTMEPNGSDVELRCLVRVAAADDGALARACADLVHRAETFGAVLHRLDGEQALGVYATTPSGGGAQ